MTANFNNIKKIRLNKTILGIASLTIILLLVIGIVFQAYICFVPGATALVLFWLLGGSFEALYREKQKSESELSLWREVRFSLTISFLNCVSGTFLFLCFENITDVYLFENLADGWQLAFIAVTSGIVGYVYYRMMRPVVSTFFQF